MAVGSAAGGGFFKFLNPNRRPQTTDISAAVTWGVAAATGALWITQPFDWLKKQFAKQPESDA